MQQPAEMPLLTAKRHVLEQKALIEKQRAILIELDRALQPTQLAEETLAMMEQILEVYENDLQRLTRRDTISFTERSGA